MQVQDSNGVTVSLSHNNGKVPPKQTLTVSENWIPNVAGKYTFQIFVWKSIEHPTALAPPVTLPVDVV